MLCSLVAAATVLPAPAETRFTVRPDGTRVLYIKGSSASSSAASLAEIDSPQLDGAIRRHSERARLDPRLVQAVIQVESAYDPRAVSRKGAMGLMQLMPSTAALLSVADPFDPEENIRGGTTYLRWMLDDFEQVLELALAGYNAGPQVVRKYGGIPPYDETRRYVAKVLGLYRGDTELSPAVAIYSRRGNRTYLTRVGGDRLLLTTTPPGAH